MLNFGLFNLIVFFCTHTASLWVFLRAPRINHFYNAWHLELHYNGYRVSSFTSCSWQMSARHFILRLEDQQKVFLTFTCLFQLSSGQCKEFTSLALSDVTVTSPVVKDNHMMYSVQVDKFNVNAYFSKAGTIVRKRQLSKYWQWHVNIISWISCLGCYLKIYCVLLLTVGQCVYFPPSFILIIEHQ